MYKFVNDTEINGSGRFYIHTSSKTLQIKDDTLTNAKIYLNNGKIHFDNLPEGEKIIFIYSVLGKLILKDKLLGNTSISVEKLSKAPYIIRLETEKGTMQKKIIIN